MTDNEIIKACPFCGDEAHLDRHDIFCDCGAKIEISAYVEGKENVGGFPTYKEAKQEMIATWNSRVDEEIINCQKAEIERLKAELKEDCQTMKQALVLVDEIKKEIAIDIETARTEAIKEFAERLHCHCQSIINEEWNKKVYPTSWADAYEEFDDVVDNLVKERVGDTE